MTQVAAVDAAAAVTIQTGAVVSKVIYRDEALDVTVFGVDAGEGLTEHTASRAAISRSTGFRQNGRPSCTAKRGSEPTLGFFVLKLLGWDRVRAYDAAMAEWANRDDTPLVL